MDVTSLPSLSDLFEGVDQWGEVLALLPVLILLELVLSADNAVALAAIARSCRQPEQERLALNIGIALALVLRIGLIVIAQWVLESAAVQLLAASYLLWLVANHLRSKHSSQSADQGSESKQTVSSTLLKTVLLLALTDLAFSIDSVATAVAISDQMLLVTTGAVIGIIALRFTSALFIRWLEQYPRLETAGFFAVAIVAIKLILHVLFSSLHQPDWLTLIMVLMLFGWGLSQSRDATLPLEPEHAD